MNAMQEYTRVFKALADFNRARILKMLEEQELCVCQLVVALGLKQSGVSKHLSVLRNAGLIDGRREGTWIYYSISRKRLNDFDQAHLGLLRNWLNEDATIQEDRAKLREVLKMDASELCTL